MAILSKNEIIEIQSQCYISLEKISIPQQDGTVQEFITGKQICDDSAFDIHKFAVSLEKQLLDKIFTLFEAENHHTATNLLYQHFHID